MDKVELEVLVNKVNTSRVKEVGIAHGGTLEDRTTAHALAPSKEPADPLAEKVIDHDILRFTFETSSIASAFVNAAAVAIGVTPDIFKSTMTARRNGEKFDLVVAIKDQAEISKGQS
jgi:hypothetical protein